MRRLAVVLSAVLVAAPAARAQDTGKGFLFQQPAATVVVRGGVARPTAGSDAFSEAARQLTLSRGDFAGLDAEADLAFHVLPRLAIVVGGAYSGVSPRSEFRNWVDQNDQPIQQTTTFQRVPLSAGVRAYLSAPGRAIGRLAWIPARAAPYVSGGGGAMWYRFRQEGDFVDYKTNDIFTGTFESSSWTPLAYGAAGLDLSLSPRWLLTTEARYTWAKATMSTSFTGFDRIDLAGLTAGVGIGVRF